MRYAKTDYGRQLAALQVQKGIKDTFRRSIAKAFDDVKFELKKANALSPALLEKITKSFDAGFAKIDISLRNIDFARNAPSNIVSKAMDSTMVDVQKAIQSALDLEMSKLSMSDLNTSKINDAIRQNNIAEAAGKNLAEESKRISLSLDQSLKDTINNIKDLNVNKFDATDFFNNQKNTVDNKFNQANARGGYNVQVKSLGTSVPDAVLKDSISKGELEAGGYVRFDDINRIGVSRLGDANVRGSQMGDINRLQQYSLSGEATGNLNTSRARGGIEAESGLARDMATIQGAPDIQGRLNQGDALRKGNQSRIGSTLESNKFNSRATSDLANSGIAKNLPEKVNGPQIQGVRRLDSKAKIQHALNTRPISPSQLAIDRQLHTQLEVNSKLTQDANLRNNLDTQSVSRYGDANSISGYETDFHTKRGDLDQQSRQANTLQQQRNAQGLGKQVQGKQSLEELDHSIDLQRPRSSGIDASSRPGRGALQPDLKKASVGSKIQDLQMGRKVSIDQTRTKMAQDAQSRMNANGQTHGGTRQLEASSKLQGSRFDQNLRESQIRNNIETTRLNQTQDINARKYQDARSRGNFEADGYARFGDINKANVDDLRRANSFGETIRDLDAAKKSDLEAKRKAAMNEAELKRLDLERDLEAKRKFNEKEKGKSIDEENTKKKKEADKKTRDAEGKRKLEEKEHAKKLEQERLKKLEDEEFKKKKKGDAERDKANKKDTDGKSKLDRVKDWFKKLLKALGLAGGLFFLLQPDQSGTTSGGSGAEQPPPPPLDLSEEQTQVTTEEEKKTTDQKKKEKPSETTPTPPLTETPPPETGESPTVALLKKLFLWFFIISIVIVFLSWIYKRMSGSNQTVEFQIQPTP